MIQITEKSIIEAVKKVDQLNEDDLEKLSETHVTAQKTLVGYILSSAIEYERDGLLDYVIYYFNVFSEAIAIQNVKLEAIDENTIDAFQEEYVQTLDEFVETEDDDLISSLCNQPMILSFFINDIFGEDEEEEKLPDEISNELFIVGIALIALLNRAIIK